MFLLSMLYYSDTMYAKQILITKFSISNFILEPAINKKPQWLKVNKNKKKNITKKTRQDVIQEKKASNKKITVKNNITTEMLTYKHWTGAYKPLFSLTVNGKKIEQGKEQEVPIKDDMIEIRYDYSFANGFKKGAKIIHCSIEKEVKNVDIFFSWDTKWHIKTEQAQPQKIETAAFSS